MKKWFENGDLRVYRVGGGAVTEESRHFVLGIVGKWESAQLLHSY